MKLNLEQLSSLLSVSVSQSGEEALTISLLNKYGYFFFAPSSESFYKRVYSSTGNELPTLKLSGDELTTPGNDDPVFSGAAFGWLEALNSALDDAGEKKAVFCDIGTFVGWVSTHLAKCSNNDQWSIRCFEPNPENQLFLRANIACNNLDRVSIFGVAVSDVEGIVDFTVGDTNRISGRIFQGRDCGHKFPVGAISITNLISKTMQEEPGPIILKIDTEGHEYKILGAIPKEHYDRIGLILAEYWPSASQEFERFLVETFDVYPIKSVQFAPPPPYRLLETPSELTSVGDQMIKASGSCDIALVPRVNQSLLATLLRQRFSGI